MRDTLSLITLLALLAPTANAATQDGNTTFDWFPPLMGVVIGSALTYFVTVLHDKRRRDIETRNVKHALLIEVSSLGLQCYRAANNWAKWVTGDQKIEYRKIFETPISEPVVFPAMQDRLGLMAGDGLGELVSFYATVNTARITLNRMSEETDDAFLPPVLTRAFVEQLEQACWQGTDALRALLGEQLPPPPDDEPTYKLTDMLETAAEALAKAQRSNTT